MLERLITALLLLFSCQLHAHVREGVYFGFGVGDAVDTYHFRVGATLTDRVDTTRDNVVLNAFLGWGLTHCSNFYFAAELGTTFPERSIQVQHARVLEIDSFFVQELCVRDYLTGDLLVGFRSRPDLLCYLRGGAAFAYGRIFQFANNEVGSPPINHTERGVGWRIGAGINYALSCHFGVGLDYIFTGYPDVHFFTPLGAELKSWVHSSYIALSTIWGF